jgi:hypothetical protein
MEGKKPGSNTAGILRHPYGLETMISKRWLMCFLFGLFVFLFLFVFQPFGLNSYPQGVLKLSLGYGLTTFVVMAILNIAVFSLLPDYFNEEHWTVGKDLGWSIINISVIGLANVLFTGFAGIFDISLANLLLYEFYTLVVGVFPVGINILIKEARLKRKYESNSEQINTELEEHKKEHTVATSEYLLTIPSDNINESLELHLNELYYIRSSDNYIEVYYIKNDREEKKLLRNSLKKVDELFQSHTQLFRCHKSYIVNLDKVKHVSGNAQGYKLHLSDMDAIVPVSRQYNEEIKERLAR